MLGFITSPVTKWIAGFVFAASIYLFAYYKGYAGEHEKFLAYKAQAEAAYNQQVKETERINAAQQQITKKAEAQYEKDLATIRAVYSRLRNQSSIGAMPGVPDPATDPAAASAYYLSVAPDLAARCAETTQQVIGLQSWILDQHENR